MCFALALQLVRAALTSRSVPQLSPKAWTQMSPSSPSGCRKSDGKFWSSRARAVLVGLLVFGHFSNQRLIAR